MRKPKAGSRRYTARRSASDWTTCQSFVLQMNCFHLQQFSNETAAQLAFLAFYSKSLRGRTTGQRYSVQNIQRMSGPRAATLNLHPKWRETKWKWKRFRTLTKSQLFVSTQSVQEDEPFVPLLKYVTKLNKWITYQAPFFLCHAQTLIWKTKEKAEAYFAFLDAITLFFSLKKQKQHLVKKILLCNCYWERQAWSLSDVTDKKR